MIAVLVAAPAAAHHEADPSAPYDFRNSEPSAFGSMAMPVYLDAPADEAVALSVPITLHPEALADPAFRYLVGFNLHDDATQLSDVALTMGGKPVAFERDVRHSELQPRLILRGDDLPRDGPVKLLLTGTALASSNGQIHVGALAMAFDAGWGTLATKDGGAAQVYTFTVLMSEGHAGTGLAPGFRGQGNSALALAPVGVLFGLTFLGVRAGLRRPRTQPSAAASAPVTPNPVPAAVVPTAVATPSAPPTPAPMPFVPVTRPTPAAPAMAAFRPLARTAFPSPASPHPVQARPAMRPARPAARPVQATPLLAMASSRVVARPQRPTSVAVGQHQRGPASATGAPERVTFEVVHFAVRRPKRAPQARRR